MAIDQATTQETATVTSEPEATNRQGGFNPEAAKETDNEKHSKSASEHQGGLFLVRKHRIGETPEELHSLSEKRRRLLAEAVQEEGEIGPQDSRYQQFLKRIYEEEYWIGCGCRKGEPFRKAPVPLMTVQNRENQYVLLRLPKRASHSDECPFEGEGA